MPGSPAAKAGFSTGDMIESIKGIGTRDMPLAYASMLLQGDAGSTVVDDDDLVVTVEPAAELRQTAPQRRHPADGRDHDAHRSVRSLVEPSPAVRPADGVGDGTFPVGVTQWPHELPQGSIEVRRAIHERRTEQVVPPAYDDVRRTVDRGRVEVREIKLGDTHGLMVRCRGGFFWEGPNSDRAKNGRKG